MEQPGRENYVRRDACIPDVAACKRTRKFGGGNASAGPDQGWERLAICNCLATVLAEVINKLLVVG